MVGPNGLEPSTSSVSRKRSNQTELRAYSDFHCNEIAHLRQRRGGSLPSQLQTEAVTATISFMGNPQEYEAAANPFQPGTMVIVTLGNPREKFWGAILGLRAEGVSLCGIELASFEDLVALIKDGEPFSPGVVFFPIHRVERMELDLPDGGIASLTQRFSASTGLDAASILRRYASHPSLAEAPK